MKAYKKSHERRVVIPCVIPWENGGGAWNRASQIGECSTNFYLSTSSHTGMSPLGSFRNQIPKVKCRDGLSRGDPGAVPGHACEVLFNRKLDSQVGASPFGGASECFAQRFT